MVQAHDGDRGVGEGENAWTCQRHLKALLFAQLAGLNSFREIEQGLSAQPATLYHLGLKPPRRSTMSDACRNRPAAVFRDIGLWLCGRATRKLRQEGQALIRLLDASPIQLREPRFSWAEAEAHIRGLKLHLLYDPQAQAPVRFALSSAKRPDLGYARTLPLEAEAIYVFDKGYTDYGWWQDIVEAKADFVTRLKTNAHRREICQRQPRGEGILADHTLKVGHKRPGGRPNRLYHTTLREIVVDRPDKEPLHLITSDLQRPAAEIAALYKQRWEIELVFKWLKQNLKIKKFLGSSENAVMTQLYVALIAFLLFQLFRQGLASSAKASPKTLLARLRVALLQAFDLSAQDRPPTNLKSISRAQQLELLLAA
jgi:putative transposase